MFARRRSEAFSDHVGNFDDPTNLNLDRRSLVHLLQWGFFGDLFGGLFGSHSASRSCPCLNQATRGYSCFGSSHQYCFYSGS